MDSPGSSILGSGGGSGYLIPWKVLTFALRYEKVENQFFMLILCPVLLWKEWK